MLLGDSESGTRLVKYIGVACQPKTYSEMTVVGLQCLLCLTILVITNLAFDIERFKRLHNPVLAAPLELIIMNLLLTQDLFEQFFNKIKPVGEWMCSCKVCVTLRPGWGESCIGG